ncbi:MAG: hypothetical protein AABY26_00350 [Nanoarchaeota archaeon]
MNPTPKNGKENHNHHEHHEHKEAQEILDEQSPYFAPLLRHPKAVLYGLLFTLLILLFFLRYTAGQPLFAGGESYYHLLQAQDSASWLDLLHLPLKLFVSIFPTSLLFILPLLLAGFSLALLLSLTKRLELSFSPVMLFLLLLLTSPIFLFKFSTLSEASLFFFLFLLGFWMLSHEKKSVCYLSLLPFLFATFFDVFTALFLLLSQAIYFLLFRRSSSLRLSLSIILSTAILTTINFFLLNLPIVSGPFHLEKTLPDLLSDLGGIGGIPLFTFLLAVLGFALAWREKKYRYAYVFLLVALPAYFLHTQFGFLLSLVLIFFATAGTIIIFEHNWSLPLLKKYTAFLLLLGLLFSTTTYLDRFSQLSPSGSETEALTWLKDNVPENSPIFSTPENSYYLSYFAQKEPLYYMNSPDSEKVNLTLTLLSSTYSSITFPLLEKHQISVLYLPLHVKQALSSEQGLIPLLRNERFKMVHSNEGAEVWVFLSPSEETSITS